MKTKTKPGIHIQQKAKQSDYYRRILLSNKKIKLLHITTRINIKALVEGSLAETVMDKTNYMKFLGRHN